MHAVARFVILTLVVLPLGAQALCFKSKDLAYGQVRGHQDQSAFLYVHVSDQAEEFDQLLVKGNETEVSSLMSCQETSLPTRCQIQSDQGRLRIGKVTADGQSSLTLRGAVLSLRADEAGDLHVGTLKREHAFVQRLDLLQLAGSECSTLFKPIRLEFSPPPGSEAPAETKR